MKNRKPLPVYFKLIVDGKLLDVFPVSSFRLHAQVPPHYRRLSALKGVLLISSSQSEYEDFIRRPKS